MHDLALFSSLFGVKIISGIQRRVTDRPFATPQLALALSATISGLIGIIEPGLYSFVIKSKQVLLAVFLGGAAGGVIMGIFQVRNSGFGLNPLGGLPVFFGDTFIYYILGVMVAFIVSASTAYFLNAPDVD